MIKCPRCNATLPASYNTCQFCQLDVSQVPRPVGYHQTKRAVSWGPPKWMYVVYYVIASYYLAWGGLWLILGSGLLSAGKPLVGDLLWGGFCTVAGLALILRWDVFRSVVYVFLTLLLGGTVLFMLLASAMTALGPMVAAVILFLGLQALMTVLMFYLYWKINEDEF